MAFDIQWLDDFTVYSTKAALLNGTPWVAIDGSTIDDDPDPTTPLGSKCFRPVLTSTGGTSARFSLSAPGTFQRYACRIWLDHLPNNSTFIQLIRFTTSGAPTTAVYQFGITASGTMQCATHSGLLAETGTPVVYAGSWNHFEFTVNTVTGAIAVWKEGSPLADLTGTLDPSPPSSTIALISFGQLNASGLSDGSNMRIKHGHYATGSSQFGPRAVLRQNIDGTVSSGWGAVNGTAEADIWSAYWNLLTFSANANANDVVLIDTTYYKFTSGSVDSGSPAGTSGSPWLVALGADAATSITNLFQAIGATGSAGTTYSTALAAHPTMNAGGKSTTQLCITAKAGTLISTGCSVPTGGARMAWSFSTLNQGANDFSYMDADATLPAASICTVADLPSWVVDIAAVMPLIRQQKSDGGTATVQDAMVSGASTASGSDRTITTAFTYYWDVIEYDPATGVHWTPAGFDAAYAKVNRTS